MKKILTIILITFSLIKSESLIDQITKMKIDQLSFEDGITHNSVFRIYQDSKGFIWFGTMFGLVKYDGVRYETFRYNPSDSNSLSNDDITAIYEDDESNFWIGTYGGGLNKYTPSQNKFVRYGSKELNLDEKFDGIIWGIIQDKNRNIWVSTNNSSVVKISDSTIKNYVVGKNNLNKIFVNSADQIYIGTIRDGLYKYSQTEDKFIKLNISDDLNKGSILSFAEDKSGKIWLGTPKNLYSLDTTKDKIVDDKILEANITINDMIIYDEEVLIGSRDNVYIFDIRKKVFNSLSEINSSAEKLNLFDVISVCRDNSGVIWLGSYNRGVHKLYNDYKQFTPTKLISDKTVRVNQIIENEDNELIVGTSIGLFRSKQESTTKINFPLRDEIYVYAISKKDEFYYIGTDKGLIIADRNFHVKKLANTSNSNLTNNNIVKILVDSKDRVWMGNHNGVLVYDSGKNKFTNINEKYKDRILGDYILSLFEDSEHTIWIGSFEGITKINNKNEISYLKKSTSSSNSLSNNYLFSFFEDKDNIWLGTGGGLNRIDKKSGKIKIYNEINGLNNAVINGILFKNNKLFLSTAKGISTLDLTSEQIINYDKKNGLHSNMFIPGSYFNRREGSLIFGGIDGYTYFSSKDYGVIQSPIEISSVEKYSNGKLSYVEKANDNYLLNYDDSQIKISFALLNYNNPQMIKYRYKIPKIDTNWIDIGFNSEIELIDLSPGKYNIILSSTNYNGRWSKREKSIALIVTPPFWKTTWFLLMLAVITLLTVIYLIHRFNQRKIRKLLLTEKIREEEETKIRKKAADDFHDELGHRITKISLYSELLKRVSADQESGSKDYLQKISELSNSLSYGVKDFIWTLDPTKDTYYHLALRIKDFGEDFFSKTGINFRVNGINEHFEQISIPMDYKRNLIFIFKEAMNNSLKYSKSENVNLRFDYLENRISIIFEDDGIGIAENKFEIGRGIKSMNNRAKTINGKLIIDSSLNRGTRINFEMNLN